MDETGIQDSLNTSQNVNSAETDEYGDAKLLKTMLNYDEDNVNNVFDEIVEEYIDSDLIEVFNPPYEEETQQIEGELLKRYSTQQLQEVRLSLGYDDFECDIDNVIGRVETGITRLYPKEEMVMKRYIVSMSSGHYITIHTGTEYFLASVDTGAGVNLIDNRAFTKLIKPYKSDTFCPEMDKPKILRFGKPLIFKTLSDKDQSVEGLGTATIQFKIGDVEFRDMFFVVDGIQAEIVLGRDFMRHSSMMINYENNTIELSPFQHSYTVQSLTIPPETELILKKLKSEGSIGKEAPLSQIGERDAGQTLQEKGCDEVQEKETIENINSLNTDLIRNHLRTMRDNVLQRLSQALEWNRSDPITEMEGVTHQGHEYWSTINQLDLDESILSNKEREQLFDAIFKQRGALSVKGEIGRLKHFYYEIKLKDLSLYNKESYRMNHITRQIMKEKIQELLDNGVVEKYMSQYSSPALLIKKQSSKKEKDPRKAKYRMVIDLREMNAQAIHLQYSLPVIHELVTMLNPTKNFYFSLLDVSDAFYQVQLHPNSYDFTTFKVVGLGSYCLTRLPQGYLGAASIFQAVIENIFPEHIRPYLTCYIDDILIMTETAEKHMHVIGVVLKTLRQNGMKLRIEKCHICPPELDFLGITLCKEGIKVKYDKVEAIVNLPVPRTKKQVRSFLGSVGYYRRYIEHFAQLAHPLYKLTKNDIPSTKIPWTEECQLSFDTLKDKLVKAPILGHIDYSLPIVLRTDASGVGIGAVLIQLKEDKEIVIAYYSRVLQPHEYNYDITTREALAMLSSIRHFSTYIRFVENYVIQSDHLDLKYIFKRPKDGMSAPESHRLIRWALYMNGYPGFVQFVSGDSPKIRMADFLSRHAYEDLNKEIGELARAISIDKLEQLEANCPDCNVDVFEKVAERQESIIPDEEQLKLMDNDKVIGHMALATRTGSTEELNAIQVERGYHDEPGYILKNLAYKNSEAEEEDTGGIETLERIISPGLGGRELQGSEQSENPELRQLPKEDNGRADETPCMSMEPTGPSVPRTETSECEDNEGSLHLEAQDQDVQSEENDSNSEFDWGIGDGRDTLVVDFEENDDISEGYQGNPIPPEYIRIEELSDTLDDYDYTIFSRERIVSMQLKDPLASSIIDYIKNDNLPPEKRKAKRILMMAESFFLDNVDNILFHVEYPAGGLVKTHCLIQLYIPEALINYLLREVHSTMHLGRSGMMAQIRQRYYFPKMNTYIEKYIQNCNICQLQKRMRLPYRAPLRTRKIVSNPAEVWYLDHMGPIKFKKKENPDSFGVAASNESEEEEGEDPVRYVLIAVDSYSLYVELILSKGTSATETADLLFRNIICRHSWPRAWVHDQGTAFTNKLLEWFSNKTGIRNYQTASMNPRSNGLAESRVKIVSIALSKLINERKGNWYDYIPSVQFAMNCVPSKANCVSPFLLQHGRKPNDPMSLALIDDEENILRTHVEYCGNMILNVKMWRDVAQESRRIYNKQMKTDFENRVRIPEEVRKGELCYLYVPYLDVATKGIRRLNIPWRGPFAISDIKDNRLVKLIRVSDLTESDKWYPIHRIKVTKYGLDPPQFDYVEGITIRHGDEEDIAREFASDDFVRQPWDDLVTIDEAHEERIKDKQKGPEAVIKKMEEIQERINENCEREIIKMSQAIATQIIDTTVNPCPEIPEVMKRTRVKKKVIKTQRIKIIYQVKLPPRVRTTRMAPASEEPIYRNITRMLKYKTRKDGTEQVQVLCEGDDLGYEMWVSVSQISPISDTPEMHERLKRDLENLKEGSKVSSLYYDDEN